MTCLTHSHLQDREVGGRKRRRKGERGRKRGRGGEGRRDKRREREREGKKREREWGGGREGEGEYKSTQIYHFYYQAPMCIIIRHTQAQSHLDMYSAYCCVEYMYYKPLQEVDTGTEYASTVLSSCLCTVQSSGVWGQWTASASSVGVGGVIHAWSWTEADMNDIREIHNGP